MKFTRSLSAFISRVLVLWLPLGVMLYDDPRFFLFFIICLLTLFPLGMYIINIRRHKNFYPLATLSMWVGHLISYMLFLED